MADELAAGARAGSRGPDHRACQNRRWCLPGSRGTYGERSPRVRILRAYEGKAIMPVSLCGTPGMPPKRGFSRRILASPVVRPPAPRGVLGRLLGCLGGGLGARRPCAKSIGRDDSRKSRVARARADQGISPLTPWDLRFFLPCPRAWHRRGGKQYYIRRTGAGSAPQLPGSAVPGK